MTRLPAFGWHRNRIVACMAAALVVNLASDARGQALTADEWRKGTTLSVFLGAASPSFDTSAAAGAAVGWEIAPHFTLEGRGLWFRQNRDAGAFAAVFGSRIPLLPARPAVPFLSAGVGLYRATFDWMQPTMPGFYWRRMLRDRSGFPGRTFDDFAVALGGGVDVFLARHLALRPDVTVLIVTTRRDSLVVPVYGVHLAYHFEEHPITPSGR